MPELSREGCGQTGFALHPTSRAARKAPGLQSAGQLMGQISREEAGLLHRPTATAGEGRDALGIRGLDAIRIGVHHQTADGNGMADALQVLGPVRMVSALPAAEGAVAGSSRTGWPPR